VSSRRIQAMAQLIDAIEARANALPCTMDSPCRCEILLLIGEYRSFYQHPRREAPAASAEQNPTRNSGVT
jgi:hypothetical protein